MEPAHAPPTTTPATAPLIEVNEHSRVEDASAASRALVPTAPATDKAKEGSADQQILALLRQSILPFSDRLDPFAALPVRLDRLQEHLVSFYLLHYPKVTYGFSPRLRPHPVATNFSIALTTPACFQVILARSALYRLSLSKYTGENEKKALEVAMMRHKGEALRLIRRLSSKSSPTSKDDLIASIISLGTLDRRTGSNDAAGMHFMAVRRILKATGGPLAVRSLLLSKVMVFFECLYGTSPESYIWDASDLKNLLPEVNAFFGRIWTLRKHNVALAQLKVRDGISNSHGEPYLREESDLHAILTRPAGPAEPNETNPLLPKHRLELITQLTCLLALSAIILDYANLPPSARMSTFTASSYQASSSSVTASSDPSAGSASSASATATSPSMTGQTFLAPKPFQSDPSNDLSSSPKPTSTIPSDSANTRPSASLTSATPATPLQTYLLNLHTTVQALSLTSQPSNNVMWQIQINDHSEAHTRRIWKSASYVWVLKHVTWNVLQEVKEWLIGFLTGRGLNEGFVEGENDGGTVRKRRKREKRFRLDTFHFSYAA